MRNKFKWFILGWAVCFIIACIAFKKTETWADGIDHKPASVAKYKVAIIYRATFATEEDFYDSVERQLEWLRKRNYIVYKLCYEYRNDMTQRLILRFAIITYREVKNVKKQKENNWPCT